MLKRVKNVLEKLKFKFKGSDNTDISNIENPVDEFLKVNAIKQPSPGLVIDSEYNETDYFRNIDLSMEVGAFSPRYYRCNKHTRYLVLRAAYGEDKIPLIKILIRTKKARLRKKLIKRISK
ncbi:hypothetical protein [uncultured Clostridium sp.]|uniref:hypothetical protein n=1 Tax=uncultured Clostridium sp. TaxID=59620 RepID=UPI002672A370|nr:hypothetical protein [uncultured Clostridium sp.]